MHTATVVYARSVLKDFVKNSLANECLTFYVATNRHYQEHSVEVNYYQEITSELPWPINLVVIIIISHCESCEAIQFFWKLNTAWIASSFHFSQFQ